MPLEIALLPRDGSRIDTPLTTPQRDAISAIAARFGGGPEVDGKHYAMTFADGGSGRLSESADTSYGMLTLRNWETDRALCVLGLMQATDRVAVLTNTQPLTVLAARDGVSLDSLLEPGTYQLHITTNPEAVHETAERSYQNWAAYRNQVTARPKPSLLSRVSSMFRGSGA